MKPRLVIGASGQVGQHLMQALGISATGTYRNSPFTAGRCLDIVDAAATAALLTELKPGVVYLPASATHVDYCETHPQETYTTNLTGVANVVEAAGAVGAKVVYFSSDYVFDGLAGPYREDDRLNPLCEYGKQKVLAEEIVKANKAGHLIIRTAGVYGPERQEKNFVYRLLKMLRAGDVLKAAEDQIGSPTYGPNLAQAVVELVTAGAQGVYHVAGPDRVSRYDFAREAAKVFGLDERWIQPISTPELNQPARRPLNGGLISAKAAAEIEVALLGCNEGLRTMAKALSPTR